MKKQDRKVSYGQIARELKGRSKEHSFCSRGKGKPLSAVEQENDIGLNFGKMTPAACLG